MARICIHIIFTLLILLPSMTPAAEGVSDTVHIGVLAKRGIARCMEQWSPTADYLTSKIPDKTFRIVPIDFHDIRSAVSEGRVDFILANSSFYVDLEHRYGVNRIATLKNRRLGGVYTRFAGVLFARSDRKEIRQLSDLKGKTFMAVEASSLGGWQMAWRELKRQGIDPAEDFRKLTFGGTHDAVVYAVQRGEVDAGTVRTDTLERMNAEGRIRLDDFSILPYDGPERSDLPFLRSTQAYPEWPFAKVKHTSDVLAEKVAVALLQMPPESHAAVTAKCAGWTIPLNYQPVRDCLIELEVSPYQDLNRVTPSRVIRTYGNWILLAFALFIVMLTASLVILKLNRRLKLSHGLLQSEVDDRKSAEAALKASNDRFRSVMDSLDSLVYVADMETFELLYVNQYGRDIWGESTGNICWKTLQSGQTAPCAFCTNSKLMDPEGQPSGVHVWEFQNTITECWYECRDQAIVWTDGRHVRMEIATDITQRKNAEAQLVSQNRFLNSALESLTHPFMVVDIHDHTIEIANSAVGEHALGKKCFEITHRTDTPCTGGQHPCPIEIIKETRRPVILEHVHYDSDGHPRNVEVHGYPIVDDGGNIQKIIEYSLDITDRKLAEKELREKEEYLAAIMATIQTGVLVSDHASGTVVDANPYASELIGMQQDGILGQPWDRYLSPGHGGSGSGKEIRQPGHGEDYTLEAMGKRPLQVRLSRVETMIKGRRYDICSLLDISDIKILLEKQAVNIELAKQLLSLVNGGQQRYTPQSNRMGLHVEAISVPCWAAGGDHYFVRTLPSCDPGGGARTVISLKDQSGHEVNCILRSIITDLVHNAILNGDTALPVEESTALLNRQLGRSGSFAGDDFLTAVNVDIDHDTLMMRFVSCGHPSFLLIRGRRIIALPEPGRPGQNLPIGAVDDMPVTAGSFQLQPGDQLILYTDGLTEMPFEKHGRCMSTEDLQTVVAQIVGSDRGRPVSEVSREILAAVSRASDQWVTPEGRNTSPDDVSIIGLEVEANKNCREKKILPLNSTQLSRETASLSRLILADFRSAGLAEAEHRVRTVLEEAVMNAWKNGHGKQPGQPVTVRWRFQNDCHIEVIDRGAGFDVDRVPDPTTPENRLKSSGRGIFMMQLMADNIQWASGGRHVIATFKRCHTGGTDRQPGEAHRLPPPWTIPNPTGETEHGTHGITG